MFDFKRFNGFSTVDVINIEVNKITKEVLFFLTSKCPIKFSDIDEAKIQIEKKYSNAVLIDFDITYELDQSNADFTGLFLENVKYILKKETSIFNNFCKIEFNNNIILIKVPNNLMQTKIQSLNFISKIKELFFNMYKLEIAVEFLIEKIDIVNKNEELFKKETEKIATNASDNTNNNAPKKSEAQIFKSDKANERYKPRVKDEAKFDILPISKISELDSNSGEVHISGTVISCERRDLKSGTVLLTFSVTDYTDTINVKYFCPKDSQPEELAKMKSMSIIGFAENDNFMKELVVMGRVFKEVESKVVSKRIDNAPVKRVELHLHTCMSAMDGINKFGDYAKLAKSWGHKAMAITDHGVVQGYPEAMSSATDDFKVIYGMEGYLIDDGSSLSYKCEGKDLNSQVVVFDIETTGFSAKYDDIIEIGAVKIKNREVIDTFNTFVYTSRKLPSKIIELTSITDDMLLGAPSIKEALTEFKNFVGEDSILVAHNAGFDTKFIKAKNIENFGEKYDMPVIDTLELSKALIKGIKNYKLNTLTKKFNIVLENHHRAVDDAKATAMLLMELYKMLDKQEITSFNDLNEQLMKNIDMTKKPTYHINILVKNLEGLKKLYQLVSKAHLDLFYKKPRILKSDLNSMREGLIIGTACEAGELYKAVLDGEADEKIEKIVEFYDFLEIQPLENNEFLVRNERVKSFEDLKDINRKIVELGEKFNKLVVATGDVHFLNKEDELYRKILLSGLGFGDAEEQAPLYLKTTNEMLSDFDYLGTEKAYEVVVTNTNLIADSIEQILPIPKGTFPPIIEGADEEFRRISYEKARSIYGENLPEIVEARLERELNSIIGNGYAVMYMISQKLVKKSNDDGYIVGSRGSVGSSFAATMSGISEVNPLEPHYICPNCKFSEFFTNGEYGSGVDLPDKNCPKCDAKLKKDGHEIPFEVFLGFEGDKEPDIDLNFAGEEQGVAMKHTEELFGKGKVFRAGTIGTIADKTAFGFVKKYFDEKDVIKRNAEINRIVAGCLGVKRTSGQHPGGVMVVPENKDIHDFTPVQYPANKKESGSITTHFDYHSISGRILKLDLLGHDTPSIIRMLEDFTGVKNEDIPLDDKDTMTLFLSPDILGITKSDINCDTGTLAIPEFGTAFVRKMLVDTKPQTFSDLLRISGLSHGTDVWVGNAQDLILNGTCTISEVISTRDDIMTYLIFKGVDKKHSFEIMEKVRKGKGLKLEDVEAMEAQGVPQWYIDSCNTIKYMFPKAHAVAYVMMSVKIAYFKVHYPEAFYASYFTMKAADFDAQIIANGIESIENAMKEIEEKGNDKSTKEKDMFTVLEVAREMYKRGYKCSKVDLYKSDDTRFQIYEGGILPPLIGLQGLGVTAAESIKAERVKGEFISMEDITKRTKGVTKAVIEVLEKHGCVKDMDKTNQMTLFNL